MGSAKNGTRLLLLLLLLLCCAEIVSGRDAAKAVDLGSGGILVASSSPGRELGHGRGRVCQVNGLIPLFERG